MLIAVTSDQESFDICVALSLISEEDGPINQFTTGFLRIRKAIKDIENDYIINLHPTNISITNKVLNCLSKSSYHSKNIFFWGIGIAQHKQGFSEANFTSETS